MPAASAKTDSNGVSDNVDSLQKLVNIFQERLSSSEKHKINLQNDPDHPRGKFFKDLSFDEITYRKLTTDQMNHLRTMDMAYSNNEMIRELASTVKSLVAEVRSKQKSAAKKASQEKAKNNFDRVKDVLMVQTSIKLMAEKPEFFSGEHPDFPKIEADYLERMQKVQSHITPICPTDSQKTIKELVAPSAEHIHLLLDGRNKMVTRATSYKSVKELVQGSFFNKCFYIEPPVDEEEVTEEEAVQEEEAAVETQQEESEEEAEVVTEETPQETTPETTDTSPMTETMLSGSGNLLINDATQSYTHNSVPHYEAPAVIDAPPPGLPHPHSVEAVVEEQPPQSVETHTPHNVSISELIQRGSFDFLQDSVIDAPVNEVYRDPAVVSIGSVNSTHLMYNTAPTPPMNSIPSYPVPQEQYYTNAAPAPQAPMAPQAVDNTPNPPPPIPLPTSLEAPVPTSWREASESWADESPVTEQWGDEQQNGVVSVEEQQPPVVEDWNKESNERSWGDAESMQWNEESSYKSKDNRPMDSWGEEPRRGGYDGDRRYNPHRERRMRRDVDEEAGWGDEDSYDSRGGVFRRGGRGGRMNGGGGFRGRGGFGNGRGGGGYGGGFRGARGMNGGNGPMRGGGIRGGGMSNGGGPRGGGSNGGTGGPMNRYGGGSNYRTNRNNFSNSAQRSYYHQQQ